MSSPSAFPQEPGIYLVSDRKVTGADRLVLRLKTAMDEGVAAIQIRERDLSEAEFLQICNAVVDHRDQKRRPTKIILNRRPHLVGQVGADGVHVGRDEIAKLVEIRTQMPDGSLIGVSCHDEQELNSAREAGTDFVTLGPFFPTKSHPQTSDFIQPEQILEWEKEVGLPVIALGGIGVDEAKQLRKQGIRRIGCIRAILQSRDEEEVAERVRQLNHILE